MFGREDEWHHALHHTGVNRVHTADNIMNVQRVTTAPHIARAVMSHGDQVTIDPRYASFIDIVMAGKRSASTDRAYSVRRPHLVLVTYYGTVIIFL